jgi:rubredoxin
VAQARLGSESFFPKLPVERFCPKVWISNGNRALEILSISEEFEKEEDYKLTQYRRILINPPPPGGRCKVCGKQSELVTRWRPNGPYDKEAEKAWEKWEKATDEDPMPWFVAEYGKEKGERLCSAGMAWDQVDVSWECRDCVVLNDEEYFKTIFQKHRV